MKMPIAQRLAGEHLLLTGATGFLAKVLLEKILRSAPEIGCVHLLVRANRASGGAAARVEKEILSSPAFSRLRTTHGEGFAEFCKSKIAVVEGDLSQDRLGLSEADYSKLCGTITCVMNSAATVDFQEQLDVALRLNTQGPQRLLQLAKDAGDIPFLHVSTCYVSGIRQGKIVEEVLPPGHTVRSLMEGRPPSYDLDGEIERMLAECAALREATQTGAKDEDIRKASGRENLNERQLVAARRDWIKKRMVELGRQYADQHGWGDTYTFTKCLGEQLLFRNRGRVPLTILRPSIIESSYEEPMPGWIDALRVADPMVVEIGKGTLTDFAGRGDISIDVIPCDIVVNACLAALPPKGAYDHFEVYQVASGQRNPITTGEAISLFYEAYRRRPMVDRRGRVYQAAHMRFHPPHLFLGKCKQMADLTRRELEVLTRLKVAPEKQKELKTRLMRIQTMHYLGELYSFYTNYEATFLTDKTYALLKSLDLEDQETFNFDVTRINWRDYLIERHIPGLQMYVLRSFRTTRPAGGQGDKPADEVDGILEAGTIPEVFERMAKTYKDKLAVQMRRGGEIGQWLRYSFRQLAAGGGLIHKQLSERGLQPGERVVICSESCPEWGLASLGAHRAGLVTVPLDPQMPVEQVFETAAFTEAKLILAGRTTAQKLEQHRATLPDSAPAVIRLEPPFVPLPDQCHVETDSAPPSSGVTESGSLVPQPVSRKPEDLAAIIFTSGTTVAPKGVMLTHGNFIANARSMLQVVRPTRQDRMLSVLPMYHAFEFTCGFLGTLATGADVTYTEQIKGPEIVGLMKETGTTTLICVPRLMQVFAQAISRKVAERGVIAKSLFYLMLRLSQATGGRIGRTLFANVHRGFGGRLWRFVSGGSALDPKVGKFLQALGFTVQEGYGLTETSPVICVNPQQDVRFGSVGPVLPDVQIRIHNPNASGIGEIWAAGPNVMAGYYKSSQLTGEVFCERWFRTGDLGYLDQDGYLFVTGRLKDMIVTAAGQNVYPDEVERLYAGLPYVKEISVVGVKVAGAGEQVHAVVVPDYEQAKGQEPREVQAAIRRSAAEIAAGIPSHQRILSIHFREEALPRTSSLKVKRSQLRAELSREETTRRQSSGGASFRDAMPGTRVEDSAMLQLPAMEWLKKTVRPLIPHHPAVEDIRSLASLQVDLGMDSIGLLELVAQIEARYGLRVPDDVVQGWKTLADVARYVADRPALERPVPAHNGPQLDRADTPEEWVSQPALWTVPIRWCVRGTMSIVSRVYVRVEVQGLENVPAEGPFIVAPNHSSHVDSVAVVRALKGRRRVTIAGAADYFFSNALSGFLFKNVFDAIPFDRRAQGLEGLRLCCEVLNRQDGLLIYPEGTRTLDGKMQSFKVGVGVLGVETRAPVIPTWIDGTFQVLRKGQKLPRRGHVRVFFGAPIKFDPAQAGEEGVGGYPAYLTFTKRVESAVRELAQRAGASR